MAMTKTYTLMARDYVTDEEWTIKEYKTLDGAINALDRIERKAYNKNKKSIIYADELKALIDESEHNMLRKTFYWIER